MWPYHYSCHILALKLKVAYIIVGIDAFLKLEPFFSYSVSKIVVKKKLLFSKTGISFFSLFAGFIPRVCWISIGGFVFLGAYEKSTQVFSDWLGYPK